MGSQCGLSSRLGSLLRWVAALFGVMLLLAACGSDPGGLAFDENGDNGEIVENGENGEMAEVVEMAEQAPAAGISAPNPDSNTAESHTAESTAAQSTATEGEAPAPTNSDEVDPDPVAVAEIKPVVFDDDFATSIQPLIADKCASCHTDAGPGASHWQVGAAQDLVDTHLLIRGVVESNYMPPWPASDDSIAFRDNRDLTPDQVQAIVDWSQAGAPIDVEPATPIEPSKPVFGLADPDMVITPAEPYAGDPNTVDDYRCQIYDPQLPDGGWITGYEFIPDQTEVVHHAIGYVIGANRAAQAEARDGEDGRPGWQCYGSSGLGGDSIFLGWAPGQDASIMPEGSGLYIPSDAFLVVQIHYHYEGDAPVDNSALALTLADPADQTRLDRVRTVSFAAPVEIPCAASEAGPLCDRAAAMTDAIERFGTDGVANDRVNRFCGADPADFADITDGVAQSSCVIPVSRVGAVGEVVSVLGHMHEIGSWFRMTLNPGKPDELVLLDIPDWDFEWQYNYVPQEPLVLGALDEVMIECGWDRARRDPSLEPAYILWADGTNDEMCFATIALRE